MGGRVRAQVALHVKVNGVVTRSFGADFEEVVSERRRLQSAEIPIEHAAPQSVSCELYECLIARTNGGWRIKGGIGIE